MSCVSRTGTDGRERLNLDSERVLAWDGCINVRDLGGLETDDGRKTRFGVAIRADSIRGLTDEGWQALANYGVERAIDLRADDEVAEDPPDAAPIPVVRVPITPWELASLREGWASMREGYLALIEHFGPRFAEVIAEVGGADGPVVIQMAERGRDRGRAGTAASHLRACRKDDGRDPRGGGRALRGTAEVPPRGRRLSGEH